MQTQRERHYEKQKVSDFMSPFFGIFLSGEDTGADSGAGTISGLRVIPSYSSKRPKGTSEVANLTKGSGMAAAILRRGSGMAAILRCGSGMDSGAGVNSGVAPDVKGCGGFGCRIGVSWSGQTLSG